VRQQLFLQTVSHTGFLLLDDNMLNAGISVAG
jgi:hypothetical protein